MWVKICGNTTLEDARFAAESGADAIGFVFAPSPRQVEVGLVQRITAKLPSKLEKYGVFVDTGFDEIVSTVEIGGLSGVQLHRSLDPLLPARLREHFALHTGKFGIMSVLPFKDEAVFEEQLTELSRSGVVDRVLVDSFSSRAAGGTGETFAWEDARSTFLRVAPHMRLIAAGGLRPENVAQAIQTLRPWGVDVVSGVESVPGRKDPARVLAFIQSAHHAAQEISQAPIAIGKA